MELDAVWEEIDRQREELAAVMEGFSDSDWETPSLCPGWRVREVGAHLTLAQMSPGTALVNMTRAGFGFNRMIRDSAVRQARLPVAEYPVRLRAMKGSRRKAPGVTAVEPLTDTLVHASDMLVPLGRRRAIPLDAAATSATRSWEMGFPFRAKHRLAGLRLVATDHDWSVGSGAAVEGTMQDLLLLVTGRYVVLPGLSGPGAELLLERVSP